MESFTTTEERVHLELPRLQPLYLRGTVVRMHTPTQFDTPLLESQPSPQYNVNSSSIDKRLPYRIGYPTLPVLPLSVHHLRRPQEIAPTHQQTTIRERFGGKHVFCHAILGDKEDGFKPGDSGSLILLDEPSQALGAVIVGLGFASNNVTDAWYMMPMDWVVMNIEQVTNRKVTETNGWSSVYCRWELYLLGSD